MEIVAEVLAQTLLEHRIEVVFGLPGGENVQVVEALRQKGIRFILVHNESSAVFMADATARVTGKPGVCLTTLGPGAANAVAGVAHAYLDRAPVLVITARMAESNRDHTHQLLDLTALYAPITKRSMRLSVTNVRQTVRDALELTRSDRPGPVHLQISNDDAAQQAVESDEDQVSLRGAPFAVARNEAKQSPRWRGETASQRPLATLAPHASAGVTRGAQKNLRFPYSLV